MVSSSSSTEDDKDLYADVDKLRKLILSLEGFYKFFNEGRRIDDFLTLSAFSLCRVAVGVRALSGVDLCNLKLLPDPEGP